MKTFTKIATALISLCIASLFTSCQLDDDEEKSTIITGEWWGDFGMFYDYNCHTCNSIHTYYADETRLVFYPSHDYSTHGYGYQKDYYQHGPYKYQYYYFYWEIEDGVLYMDYPHDNYLNAEIYNYHMSDYVFEGRIGEDGDPFCLHKVADISDWTPLYDYDYYYYEERYYWHSVANKACSADSLTSAAEGVVARRGNVYAAK